VSAKPTRTPYCNSYFEASSVQADAIEVAAFKLSVSISVQGADTTDRLSFSVTDADKKGTGQLTASITLPAGSSLPGPENWQGWACKPMGAEATCTHSAISAGQQAQSTIFIQLNGPQASGQPVELSVRSGSVSASTTSSQDIECQSGHGH
jgi:hypothetical protein